jgi:hypothetical protein
LVFYPWLLFTSSLAISAVEGGRTNSLERKDSSIIAGYFFIQINKALRELQDLRGNWQKIFHQEK